MDNPEKIEELPRELSMTNIQMLFSDDKNFVRMSIQNIFKNSFIHCILSAYSKEYVNLNEENKKKFVMNFFLGIEPVLKMKHWERLSRKIQTKLNFQDILKSNIKKVYSYFLFDKNIKDPIIEKLMYENTQNGEEKELYKIIFEVVDIKNMENNIIPQVYKKCSGLTIQQSVPKIQEKIFSCSKKLFDSFGDEIDNNKKKYCLSRLNFLFGKIISLSENMCMKNHTDFLKRKNLQINDVTIDVIAKAIDRDIYFIDYKNSLPVVIGKVIIKNRKSIVLIKFEDSFEVLGYKTGNEICKEFKPENELIIKIKNFIGDSDFFKTEYPKLKKYLPYKSEIIRKRSYSESSSSSDDD